MDASHPRPFAIDTDPGIDDALALILAFRAPRVSVELITTVAGNLPLRQVTYNARLLTALAAPATTPPIVSGAARPLRGRSVTATHIHGDDGLGGLTALRDRRGAPLYDTALPPASRGAPAALLDCARRHAGNLTVVALGPLTNIALALQADAQTLLGIERLVVMGGAIGVGGNISAAAEFNFRADPHAAELVLGSGLPITLVPLDVTREVRLTRELLRRETGRGRAPLSDAIRRMSAALLRERGELILHDPLALAAAIWPDLVDTSELPVHVECEGRQTLGASIADRRAHPELAASRPRIDVALRVDSASAIELFSHHVLRADRGSTAHRQAAPRSRDTTQRAAGRSGRHPPGVLVVGGANVDISIRADRLPVSGETIEGGRLHRDFGGKAANQAIAARRAGAHVRLLGRLGADGEAQQYLRHLQREGIDTELVQLDRREATGTALILVDAAGRNLIAVAPGANSRLSGRALAPLRARWPTDIGAVLASMEASDAVLRAAFVLGRRHGVPTILNAAPARPLSPSLARLVDVLVVNEVEAQMLSGQPVEPGMSTRAIAGAVRALPPEVLIVTLGQAGTVWLDRRADRRAESGRIRAKRVRAVDTVGAGDTFVGYLACALAEGLPLRDALALASDAATLSVTQPGAQSAIPGRRAVQRFRAR
ncbi:MAG: nucleoside hydrolase [Gammaproteobacteria bacterium]|nr:nucleoside hydrolase [Gammaproteobacteria bacterium]